MIFKETPAKNLYLRLQISSVGNPFQPSVVFHIETSHLICIATTFSFIGTRETPKSSYRDQAFGLQSKSMDWFLYDDNFDDTLMGLILAGIKFGEWPKWNIWQGFNLANRKNC